jgi:hypothetical protein
MAAKKQNKNVKLFNIEQQILGINEIVSIIKARYEIQPYKDYNDAIIAMESSIRSLEKTIKHDN